MLRAAFANKVLLLVVKLVTCHTWLFSMIFAFDEDVTLSVEGQFEYTAGLGSEQWTPRFPCRGSYCRFAGLEGENSSSPGK